MEHFVNILKKAYEVSKIAYESCTPTPQAFYSADLSGRQLTTPVVDLEGDCGGAYLTGIGGRDEIVRFYKKYGRFNGSHSYSIEGLPTLSKSVYKGYEMMIPSAGNSQSAERKAAQCRAFAKVLNENGIRCSVKTYLS
jgi:hypothetical protein